MKALIAAHLKRKADDDETATMLAIKPLLVESFGENTAEHLFTGRLFKDYFVNLRAAQARRLEPSPKPKTPKLEIV